MDFCDFGLWWVVGLIAPIVIIWVCDLAFGCGVVTCVWAFAWGLFLVLGLGVCFVVVPIVWFAVFAPFGVCCGCGVVLCFWLVVLATVVWRGGFWAWFCGVWGGGLLLIVWVL